MNSMSLLGAWGAALSREGGVQKSDACGPLWNHVHGLSLLGQVYKETGHRQRAGT